VRVPVARVGSTGSARQTWQWMETKAMTIRLQRIAACTIMGWFGLAGSVPLAKADPLVSQGIGAANCAQLAGDIKPGDGLNNRFNLALFAWVQGYVSAANIALLEESGKLIDLTGFDDATVLRLVQEFCKANPDKKPIGAIDALIRASIKMKADWQQGTVDWEQ
jgi:hypothetical protein